MIGIQLRPPRAYQKRQRFSCPHCGHTLPVDEETECSRCGAYLELKVETRVPPQKGGGL